MPAKLNAFSKEMLDRLIPTINSITEAAVERYSKYYGSEVHALTLKRYANPLGNYQSNPDLTKDITDNVENAILLAGLLATEEDKEYIKTMIRIKLDYLADRIIQEKNIKLDIVVPTQEMEDKWRNERTPEELLKIKNRIEHYNLFKYRRNLGDRLDAQMKFVYGR